ncbi:MAG: FAD-binding domain-containing protein, partial [Pseudomonadota bacterium]
TLARHRFRAAEKFVQEVYWRAYFKGWLERRPAVWDAYREETRRRLAALRDDPPLADRYEAAVEGRTGIEGFDDWARELVETGWLHNHARMWFASIWIFTLDLPWTLGADFFLRHLMDGDAASNTLSWRWVGGLHTRGKTYLARASNIEKYTDGRFRPEGLAPAAPPLAEPPPPAARPAPVGEAAGDRLAGLRYGLLVTDDDLHPESLPLDHPPAAVLLLSGVDARSRRPVGEAARRFAEGAMADAAARAEAHFDAPVERSAEGPWRDAIADWAARSDLSFVVVARPPVGPAADLLSDAEPSLEAGGVRLIRIMRLYDEIAWPHAHKGFFALRQKIPAMLAELGLA